MTDLKPCVTGGCADAGPCPHSHQATGGDLWRIMMALTQGDPDYRVTRALEVISEISKRFSDGGEAVHGQVAQPIRDEPKDSLSGPTGEVGGVPEGWVLVPREPTEAMTRAWWRSHFSDDPVPGGRGDREAYQAMIAAAPPSREA